MNETQTKDILQGFQVNEITESLVYEHLAAIEKNETKDRKSVV